MKKRVAYALMILVTLSMLVSSFARAQSADDNGYCSSGRSQLIDENIQLAARMEAQIPLAKTAAQRSRLQQAVKSMKALNEKMSEEYSRNCP